ncbi:flagellar hook-associated protein 3, partial [Aliarcobacter butzleri]
ANGKLTYNRKDSLRKITVDEGSYRESGVNGLEAFFYQSDEAIKGGNLTFKADDRILDRDGTGGKVDTVANAVSKEDWGGSF